MQTKVFQRIILAHIIANIVSMCVEWHGQPESVDVAQAVLETYFCAVFALEFVFKLGAWGALSLSNIFMQFECAQQR